jgi:hypothetical protein
MAQCRCLNADLDLTSEETLAPLAAYMRENGLIELHCERHDDGAWLARFEASLCGDDPERQIGALLDVVEKAPESVQASWRACASREFDIGYECGDDGCPFGQTLSADLVRRIAAVGASLGITLYPAQG